MSFPPDSGQNQVPGIVLVKGSVTRVTYRSHESGFCVLRVDLDGVERSLRETTLIGTVPTTLDIGGHFVARGTWQKHPKFGTQFRAYSITEAEPTSAEGILRYLSSGSLKGLGPKLAERIVNAFGDDTLKILQENPERLEGIPGIGPKKLAELKSAWSERQDERETLLFFHNHGVPSSLAQRLFRRYGKRTIEIVRENPYSLCDDLFGIGFLTADKLAMALGIAPNSTQRYTAILEFILKQASDDGQVFLPKEVLLARARRQLGTEEDLEQALSQAVSEKRIFEEQDRCYNPQLYLAESTLAEEIAVRIDSREKPSPISEVAIQKVAKEEISAPSGSTVRLSEDQIRAIQMVATNKLAVITGGPGCGKTTLTQAIVKLLVRTGFRVGLCAPTGRAAQRLSEVCGEPASTIHRMLRFDPATRGFELNEETPLEFDAVIVDESSMLDLPLALSLLRAIPKDSRVIFIGDVDQLPSVGPGLVLADLLSIEVVPRVRLTNLFRRSEESRITLIAHQINSGDVPSIPEPDGVTKSDAYFLAAEEPVEVAALVEKLVCEQIPKKFGFAGLSVTVLTPMNQGDIGVVQLNKRLQERLLPNQDGVPKIKCGDLEFRLGDRVCQRVNNYTLVTTGIFNGDQGEVIGIDVEQGSLVVRLWDGREIEYPNEAISQLDLAYALSIHRSQGSEVPAVVVVLHEAHSILLERQLLYTAVTRAKKLLIIVGTKRALALATKKSRGKKRYSALPLKVSELLAQQKLC